jgi:hypothetical protein
MELAPPQGTARRGVPMHEPPLGLRRPCDKPGRSLSVFATMATPLHVKPVHVHAGDRAGLVSRHERRGQGGTLHPFGNESCKHGIHRGFPGVNL